MKNSTFADVDRCTILAVIMLLNVLAMCFTAIKLDSVTTFTVYHPPRLTVSDDENEMRTKMRTAETPTKLCQTYSDTNHTLETSRLVLNGEGAKVAQLSSVSSQ